jgi:arginyl-tRNA---protein transferase
VEIERQKFQYIDPASEFMNRPSSSIIRYNGINPHECGYCKIGNSTSSVSFGFLTEQMEVRDYEQLMLINWRRSGTYCYRPLNHKTCCPMYTIRLQVSQFQPSKSQKKVFKNAAKNLNVSVDALDSAISITTEPSSFTGEKFALYKKYQIEIHKDKEDDLSETGFTRFLVTSPLKSTEIHPQLQLPYGSYHQLYRLVSTNELIAVGVIDLLPTGVSSVYCFYDPAHRDLVLGKYTALKEIAFSQQYEFSCYYMGFYIHNCEKMRYKGEYRPSELLCPVTLSWVPLADCIPLLDEFIFTPFAEPFISNRREIERQVIEFDGTEQEKQTRRESSLESLIPNVPISAINNVNLQLQRRLLKLNDLNQRGLELVTPCLQEFVQYVGEDMAKKLIFFLG